MDSQIISATTGFIGALVTLLGAIGGGIAFLLRRADKRREVGETRLLDTLRHQVAELKAGIRWRDQIIQIQRKDGTAWREQLLRHDIDPDPAEWTEWPEQPEERPSE